MTSQPRYLAAAAVMLAASLLVTGPASAGPASPATTAQGGVFARAQTPISGPWVDISSHQEQKASVSCGRGTRVTGGGGESAGLVIYLTDSYPAGNGWTVWAYNPGQSTRMRAWAVCSSALTAPLTEVRSAVSTLRPGQSGTAIVRCGTNMVAIGGGGSGPGIAYLTRNRTYGTETQSDGWLVTAYNPGTSPVTLAARALCKPVADPQHTGQRIVSSPAFTIRPGWASTSWVRCPAGTVPTGGGSDVFPYLSHVYLTGSHPNTAVNGWTVSTVNRDTESRTVYATAVCDSRL